MICPKCNRLNDDKKIVCRFCGEVLKTNEYELLTDEEKQLLILKEKEKEPEYPFPKYRKKGWILIVGAVAIVLALILSILNFTSPSKNAVVDYANAYYNADFELTAQASAVNLRKYYETTNKASIFDFFGLFNRYSSYEDMLNQYMNAFSQTRQEIESICGADYEVNVKIKKEVKLNETMMFNLISEYQNLYGNILREGEFQQMRFVYAEISIDGSNSSPETVEFTVLKISDEWYVLTDSSLHAY